MRHGKEKFGAKCLFIIMIGSLMGICGCGSSASNEASVTSPSQQPSGSTIIDHRCTDFDQIPSPWITAAKNTLRIAYGHTSHGSQLVTGMQGLITFKGPLYSFNSGGTGGALDLRAFKSWDVGETRYIGSLASIFDIVLIPGLRVNRARNLTSDGQSNKEDETTD